MAEKRLRRARRIVALSLALLLLVIAAAGGFLLLWRNSVRQKNVAQSSFLAALAERRLSTDPEQSALLALKAEGIAPTPQAADALAEALPDIQEIRTMSVGSAQTIVWRSRFSPDGREIVTANSDGTVDVFSTQTGRLLRSIRASRSGIFSAVYNPRGDRILTASSDGTAEVFDAQNGKRLLPHLIRRDQTSYYVRSAAYSPDGSVIAATHDGSQKGYINLWTSSGRSMGQPIEVSHITTGLNYVNDVAFSPDGTEIATASGDGTVNLFSRATGLPVMSPLVPGDNATANTVAFSPDGKSLVVAYQDGRVVDWEVSSGRRAATFATSGSALSAAFSPDGAELVATNDLGNAIVWNIPSQSEVADLSAHVGNVESAVFSPDGKSVLTANYNGTVTLWHVQPRVLNLTSEFYTGQAPVSSVRYISGTERVVGASWTRGVTWWDPKTGWSRFRQGDSKGISSLTVEPGYALFAVNFDGSVNRWDLSSLKPLEPIGYDGISVFAFRLPDTRFLGYDNGFQGQVGVSSHKIRSIQTLDATSAAFNPAGQTGHRVGRRRRAVGPGGRQVSQHPRHAAPQLRR